MSTMLTTTETCKRLRVSRATLHRLVQRQKLHPQRYDNHAVRYRAEEVDALAATRPVLRHRTISAFES